MPAYADRCVKWCLSITTSSFRCAPTYPPYPVPLTRMSSPSGTSGRAPRRWPDLSAPPRTPLTDPELSPTPGTSRQSAPLASITWPLIFSALLVAWRRCCCLVFFVDVNGQLSYLVSEYESVSESVGGWGISLFNKRVSQSMDQSVGQSVCEWVI